MANLNVYQMVTDRIVEMMNQGIIPWEKPWKGMSTSLKDCAISYTSRKPYSLLNQILLGEEGEYITFNECTKLGGKVKKGAKSRIVVFFKPLVKKATTTDEETGEEIEIEKRHYMLQYYRVFHLNDCEGIKSKFTDDEQTETTPVEVNLDGEKVIEDYIERESANGFSLEHKSGDSAYYQPSLDRVVLPLKEQFKSIAEYYSTAFHEIAHSTMKECRCNRRETEPAFFGSESYSKEELVAEMTSANICSVTGIETASSFRNSTAYIQSWLKALKNDPKMIVFASAQAERATKYILGIA